MYAAPHAAPAEAMQLIGSHYGFVLAIACLFECVSTATQWGGVDL